MKKLQILTVVLFIMGYKRAKAMTVRLRTMHSFALILVWFFAFTATATAQPMFHIDKPLQVIEADSSGQEVTTALTITNNGTEDLQLKVENTSCGCTGAVLSSTVLVPKQAGTLNIKMQVSGWGTKTETVTLSTNDPKQPHPVVTTQVKMPATVVANPARLMIQTREGQEARRFLSLLLPNNTAISKISTRPPFVTAKLIESDPITGGTLQRIEVVVEASAPAEKLTGALTIELKDAPIPQISVPIEGFVEPDINVEPHQIFLGQVANGSTLRKVVVVRSYNKRPFAIKRIESDSPHVMGKTSPDVTADAHAVEVDVKVEGQIGSLLQDTVKLTLSNGRNIEIPVVGMITKSNEGNVSRGSTLQVDVPAPDFTAMDSNGNTWKLSDLHGKQNVLLTFFPRCFTGGCAGQLASLQQELPNFARHQTEVWAVSVDAALAQAAFAAHLGLQFPLLPDTNRELSMLFGAALDKTDLASRQSILIDKAGIVRWIDTNVSVSTHGADVLAKMRELGLAP